MSMTKEEEINQADQTPVSPVEKPKLDEENVVVSEKAELKKSDEPDLSPAKGQVQLKISKKKLWIGGILGLLLILGGLTWYFRWYQPLLDIYNTASIAIKVKTGEQLGLAEAKLVINGKEYLTDQNGQVSIEKILAGEYDLKVSKDGYQDATHHLTIKRGENPIVLIDLTKTPEKVFTIKGYVFDLVNGLPLTDCLVTLNGNTVRTNPAGEYTFEKQIPGEYKLVFAKTNYLNKELTVTLAEADLTTSQVNLTPSGQVVMLSNRDGGNRAIYLSNYDGTDQRQLVKPVSGSEDYSPMLSPDGKWVLFVSNRDGITSDYGSKLGRLYLVGIDGKNLRKVSDDYNPYLVRWSPNSQFFYFEGYGDKAFNSSVRRFYRVASSQLTDLGEVGSNVTFSNSGTNLVYTVTVDVPVATPTPTDPIPASPEVSPTPTPTPAVEHQVAIKKLELSSGEKTTLVQKKVSYYQNLTWNSKDTEVTYEAKVEVGVQRFSVNVSTKAEQALVYDPAEKHRSYSVSPDGRLKVFIEERDGKSDLYSVDAAGLNEKRLTTLGVVNSWLPPRFDDTSKYIVFYLQRQGESAWYIIGKDGGEPHKVADVYNNGDNLSYDY